MKIDYKLYIRWDAEEREQFVNAMVRIRIADPDATHTQVVKDALLCLPRNRRREVGNILTQPQYSGKALSNIMAERNIQREKETLAILSKPVQPQGEDGILISREMIQVAIRADAGVKLGKLLEEVGGEMRTGVKSFLQGLEELKGDLKAAVGLCVENMLNMQKPAPITPPQQEAEPVIPTIPERAKTRKIAIFGVLKKQAELIKYRFKDSDLEITYYLSDGKSTYPRGYFEKLFIWVNYSSHSAQEQLTAHYDKSAIVLVNGGMNAIYKNIRKVMNVK